MARKYTSKDIKSMIDKHTEILESLENSFSQPTIYGNKIQACMVLQIFCMKIKHDIFLSTNQLYSNRKLYVEEDYYEYG